MKQAKIAATTPTAVELRAGEILYWCRCGRSGQQPTCDDSHQNTTFEPLVFTADKSGKYFFCQCKHTKTPPLCDGSHKKISQEDLDAAQGIASRWYKLAELKEMQDGEVRSVHAGKQAIALTFHRGQYGALDNACPHQGGPLGEGSIECNAEGDCWLRCPWHGWDFDPLSGRSPERFGDGVNTYPVEVRDDGIYARIKEPVIHQRTVSDLMVETMLNWGVCCVFGMVGHSNLGLADAVRIQEENKKLTYIGVRHEGAAAFACSGYAKLTGKPAVCMSVAGPGATNLLTGLWDARVDRAPVLALTGQVNTQVLGLGAFQEIDLADAFAAVSGFSQTVLTTSKHAELMNLAVKHALVERNVSHLIFPDAVQVMTVEENVAAGSSQGRLASKLISPPSESLAAALTAIKSAHYPVVIVGYGARESMSLVQEFAERIGAPVLTTFKAKGQISDAHPLAAGVLGRSGTPVSSYLMNESDLLIILGASFSDHTGITPKKKTIQVDFEQMALGKFHAVGIPVWGEIGVTVGTLLEHLSGHEAARDPRAEIAERWRLWRKEKTRRVAHRSERGLGAAEVFSIFSELCPADAVISVDVGNNAYSFGRYFECREQRILMSGYLGSIGFGFPAAMGAWAATQSDARFANRPVVAISGDGGFGQYLGEFTTAVKYGMKIIHVLLNNQELGKISKEQRAGHWPVWQTGLHNPDFSAYAELCGGFGRRVSRAEDLSDTIALALAYAGGPALVEVLMDPDLN